MATATGQPRVLVVEDEPAIADAVIYSLRSEGFEALWKSTGREALEAATAWMPALIILDVGLPDMSGFDVCRELRRTSDIPVIFLTARAEEVDRVVGLEIGADDYVVKPFSPRELSARVRAILRRTGEARQTSAPAMHAFQVDDARMRISYHDMPLELSRYEYRLLKVLLEQPGRVFSREQLLQAAWEHPDHSLDRTVDTHIKTLRAKLRAVTPDADPIKTHRGVGYSLDT